MTKLEMAKQIEKLEKRVEDLETLLTALKMCSKETVTERVVPVLINYPTDKTTGYPGQTYCGGNN